MFSPEDPLDVLLSYPPRDPDERASAMHRLKEPIRNGGTQEDQDSVLAVLEKAATADASPVLRLEAITALGGFEDERAHKILMVAYQNAHGRKDTDPAPVRQAEPGVITAGSRGVQPGARAALQRWDTRTGPTGFPADWVTAIRCRAVESLGRTNRPEAAKFLAAIAGGAGKDVAMEGSEDRDVRLAAVRGLGKCRQPEAVAALAEVLKAEAETKDTAMIGRTHQGLVHLTGKKLPADPQVWNEVVQAGVTIAPEPTWLDKAVETAMFWEKK
jgi:HEAT repeat protein